MIMAGTEQGAANLATVVVPSFVAAFLSSYLASRGGKAGGD